MDRRKLPFVLALIVGLVTASQAREPPDYYTDLPVLRGNTVYLTQSVERSIWTPVSPEGAGWVPWSTRVRLYAADLERGKSLRAVSRPITVDLPPDTAFRFVEFDARGRPGLRAPSAVLAVMRKAAGASCEGAHFGDLQDSRVSYFTCPGEGVLYRFVEPSLQPQAFRLTREQTHAGYMPVTTFQLYSSAGESKPVLHEMGTNYLELDPTGASQRRIDPFDGFSSDVTAVLARHLVAITSTMRIASIFADGPVFGVEVLRPGEPARRHVHRDDSLSVGMQTAAMQPLYLAEQDMVLWQIAEKGKPRLTLLLLDLKTGTFRSTSFRL